MQVFKARVEDGKVYQGDKVVEDCPINGIGGDSEGVIVISQDELIYIPKTQPDLNDTLEILFNMVNTIVSGILDANLGGAIKDGSFNANMANIATEIQTLQGKLK